MAPTGLQERGYFLVRLRFDGPQAAYIQTWFAATGTAIGGALSDLAGMDRDTVRRHRREKFLNIGRVL